MHPQSGALRLNGSRVPNGSRVLRLQLAKRPVFWKAQHTAGCLVRETTAIGGIHECPGSQ